jgi:hypothetical protein
LKAFLLRLQQHGHYYNVLDRPEVYPEDFSQENCCQTPEKEQSRFSLWMLLEDNEL